MHFITGNRVRKTFAALVIGSALAIGNPTKLAAQGFLKTSGENIVNEKGETVILRGMGLGGWMLQEGYMFHAGNIGQQYRIKEKITELVGAEKADDFYDNWLLNHTRKIDIDSMAAWGFNSIRLPMHYALYTLPVEAEKVPGENTWLEKGFALTDSLLNWCKANKMYLILDLHAAPGGQGNDLNISDRNPDKPSLWDSEANQKKMIALWQKLATRYANEPWIGGYDIINEPNWGFEDSKDKMGIAEKKNEPLRKLMMDITTAIRAVDKKHIIIIEGNGFGNNYNGVLPAWDDNIVLSFHKYGNFTTKATIQQFIQLRGQYKLPLWLGETGENSNTWFTETIQLAESNNIGWAWWQERKMGINNPLEIKVTPAYQKLLDYWNEKSAKPSATEAEQALNELLQNIKLENNIYHPDVIDAMFRQVTSTETKPFVQHTIKAATTINAVDFDLGKQRYAYYDKDTSSYHYTPGVNTVGNRGRAYRNDGVDIKQGTASFYVFNIEDDEWLQYTVTVENGGKYNIGFTVSSPADTASFSLYSGNQLLVNKQAVPNTGGDENWQVIKADNIYLQKGTHQLKLKANKGGFTFAAIQFTKQ